MTTVAPSIGVMELVAGSQVLPVVSLGTELLSLNGRLGDTAARLDRFVLSVVSGASRIDVPFRGRAITGGGEIIFAPEDRPRLAAAAAGQLSALVTPHTPVAVRRRGRPRYQWLAVLACVVLGGYVGLRLWNKVTTIEPRVAYLATEVTTLLSPTSGRITFVEATGPVDAGQPTIGLETTSGKSLLIDAPGRVDIVAAEKSVGERVKRGDPLLAYAQPDAPAYLYAIVDRDQAFRIATGTRVSYSRLDAAGDPVRFAVAAADLHVRALPHEGDHQLFEVRIPIVSSEQFRALPVRLRFEQDPISGLAHTLRTIGVPDALLGGLVTTIPSAGVAQ
jgi:hypothetical protein